MVMLILVALAVIGAPVAFIVEVVRTRAELRRLRARVEHLESLRSPERPAGIPDAFATANRPVAPLPSPALSPPPSAPGVSEEPSTLRTRSNANFEQLIGGVWLQNIGSVLVLVGVFLMILWGY